MPLKPRATEPDGVRAPKLDDDVEGHAIKPRAIEPDGHMLARAAGGDVEGHAIKVRAVEPDGVRAPKADDDDVEGHMMGSPIINEQLARAREQDIQRSMRDRQARADASRPHKK
jgi:hypothetical protein